MDRILMVMSVQGAMGAFDLFYHHEITERLAWRAGSARELSIHAARNAGSPLRMSMLACGSVYGPDVS